jgi:hypothetical protein
MNKQPPPQPPGWKNVGVHLPSSVVAIIAAAGGAESEKGGMPRAMASIVGALPWIAVALYQELPAEEYAAFAGQVKANMQQAWQIIGADDPKTAFDVAFEAAKKAIN